MKTCSKCGQPVSVWKAGLLSGLCQACRKEEARLEQARHEEEARLEQARHEEEARLEQARHEEEAHARRITAEENLRAYLDDGYQKQLKADERFLQTEAPKRVRFQTFKSRLDAWEWMFNDAAKFADSLPPNALIGFSHSSDQGKGVVTVWYWERAREMPHEAV
jgi:hypothetical protein